MMTFCAFFMMKAASSAEPSLAGFCFAAATAGRSRLAAEAAEDHRDEGAVHRVAHDVGQDRAEEPTSAPVMISAELRA